MSSLVNEMAKNQSNQIFSNDLCKWICKKYETKISMVHHIIKKYNNGCVMTC